MDLRLDARTLKALASPTRARMLKLLGDRRYLQSELADLLDLSVPTVNQHLGELVKAGLVERRDEGRKWKYYALTGKGRAVLAPERTKIFIVLSLLVLSAVGTAYSWSRSLSPVVPEFAPQAKMMALEASSTMASAPAQAPPALPLYVYVLAGLTIVLAVFLIMLVVRQLRYRSRLGKNLIKS